MRSRLVGKRAGFSAATIVLAALIRPEAVQCGDAEKVTAELTRIEEVRRVRLVAQRADEPAPDFDPPRLSMHFRLHLPGAAIASIEQPSAIKALDAAGKDLTEIPPNLGNEREFVKLVEGFGEEPKEMSFRLAPPSRGARTFSLDATFDVWVYDEIKELTFRPRQEKVSFNARKLGNQRVTAELRNVGAQTRLTITPGTVKRYIESIAFTDGRTSLESHAAEWNDEAVTYTFQQPPTPDMKVRINIRTKLRSLPCRIQLQDQPLP